MVFLATSTFTTITTSSTLLNNRLGKICVEFIKSGLPGCGFGINKVSCFGTAVH